MVGESNQNIFLIQINVSSFVEFEISEFEISRFNCICVGLLIHSEHLIPSGIYRHEGKRDQLVQTLSMLSAKQKHGNLRGVLQKYPGKCSHFFVKQDIYTKFHTKVL